MLTSRRALLLGLGGVVASSGALVGTGALDAFQAQRSANIPITTDSQALVAIEVPQGQQGNDIIQENNGNVEIDFTAPSNSDGVQTNATYQLGGIDMSESRITNPLNNDNVVGASGFPSPVGGGSTQSDPALLVRNNSNEKLGVTAEFSPNSNFPTDGRLFIVMHDVGQASSGGNDIRSELYGPNGLGQSAGTNYRPVYSGEALAISIWVYTGGSGNQNNPDLSGELLFTAQDADDVTVGQD